MHVSETVRAELEDALDKDTTRLGDVFRLRCQGMSPAEMAASVGVDSPGLAYSWGQMLDIIVGGHPPRSAHIAGSTARRLGPLIGSRPWSAETDRYLQSLQQRLIVRAG
ncbi:hypothetical protein GCM10027053_21650 [Intrasporangium mesophilum]